MQQHTAPARDPRFVHTVIEHSPPLWVPHFGEWMLSQRFARLAETPPAVAECDARHLAGCPCSLAERTLATQTVYIETHARKPSGRDVHHVVYVPMPADFFGGGDPAKVDRARVVVAAEQQQKRVAQDAAAAAAAAEVEAEACWARLRAADERRQRRATRLALRCARLWLACAWAARARRKRAQKQALGVWRDALVRRARREHSRNLDYNYAFQHVRHLMRTVAAWCIARDFLMRLSRLADFRYRVGWRVVHGFRRWRTQARRRIYRVRCAALTCRILWADVLRKRRVLGLVDKALFFFHIYRRRKEFVTVSIIVVTWLSVAMPVLDTLSNNLTGRLFPLGAAAAEVLELIESARRFFHDLYSFHPARMTQWMPVIETYAIEAITRRLSTALQPLLKQAKRRAPQAIGDRAELVGLVGKWENLVLHLSTLAASFERLFFHYVETSPREQRVFAVARHMPSPTVTGRTMTLPECWAMVIESICKRQPKWRPVLGMSDRIVQVMFFDLLKSTSEQPRRHACGRCFTQRPRADCRKPLTEFVSRGHLQMFCRGCMAEGDYADQPKLAAEALEMIFMDMIQTSGDSKSYFIILPDKVCPAVAATVQNPGKERKTAGRKKQMKK